MTNRRSDPQVNDGEHGVSISSGCMYMKSVPSICRCVHEGRYHSIRAFWEINRSETSDLYSEKSTPRRPLFALRIPEKGMALGRIRSLHKLLRGTLQIGLC